MPLAESDVLRNSGADARSSPSNGEIEAWVERGYGRRL
jgi:hypothetical protein